MKINNFAAAAAALTLVAAPAAAQAAPQRAAAPVEQGSEARSASAWIIGLLALIAIITAVIIASKDRNDAVSGG